MQCTVQSHAGVTQGTIRTPGSDDVYLFELDYMNAVWRYLGKRSGPSFISSKVQGFEHIANEFIDALDAALVDPNGYHEFPDPMLDDLEVAGS